MHIREVSETDTVRVTVYRRFGEELECAEYWDTPVVKVDAKNGRIGIESIEPRWLEIEGLNTDGLDPAYTDTRLLIRKNVEGAKFERLFADEPVVLGGQGRGLEDSNDNNWG